MWNARVASALPMRLRPSTTSNLAKRVGGTTTEHRELAARLQSARRVLVVDDHEGFRRCARALLTEAGFDVVGEAETGAAAVSLAGEVEPDLVLLDVQLPDFDGFDVAARLLERDAELRIVLVSSRDRTEYGSLIESSGAIGFISKGDLSREVIEELLG
jgi:DNA-binding NarL/FixJ family response regulator